MPTRCAEYTRSHAKAVPVLVSGLELLALACLAVEMSWIWARHPRLTWTIALALFFLESLYGSPTGISIASLHVYPEDLLWITALISTAWAGRTSPLIRRGSRPLQALLMLTLVMLAAGIAIHGLNAAGVEARTYVYFLAAAVYALFSPASAWDQRWLLRAWTVLATGLCIVAIAHWARFGIGTSTSLTRVIPPRWFFAGAVRDARALPAPAAVVIAQAAMIVWLGADRIRFPAALRRVLIALFLITAVLLQHRTVWIATLAAAAVALLWRGAPESRARAGRHVAVVLVTASAVGAYVVGSSDRLGITSNLGASTNAALGSNSTFIWRLDSWQALLRQPRSAVEWAVGTPFGAGYARVVPVGPTGSQVTVSPHDFFVQTLLRLGVAGLVLLLFIYCTQLVGLWRTRLDVAPLAVALLTVSLLLYVSYAPTYDQGLILGLVMAWTFKGSSKSESR
jgi:hypothetical protein